MKIIVCLKNNIEQNIADLYLELEPSVSLETETEADITPRAQGSQDNAENKQELGDSVTKFINDLNLPIKFNQGFLANQTRDMLQIGLQKHPPQSIKNLKKKPQKEPEVSFGGLLDVNLVQLTRS